MHQSDELFARERNGLRIGHATDEAGQQDLSFRRAVCEDRRIPDGAESLQARGTRHQETETVESVADLASAISQRNDGDRSIFDSREEWFKCSVDVSQELCGGVRWRGHDQRLRLDGLLLALSMQQNREGIALPCG